MTVLFGNGTEELSASFVGLKKANTENPTQEPGDGKPESQRRQNTRDSKLTRALSAYRASSLLSLPPSPAFQKMSVHFWTGLVSAKSLCEMRIRAEETQKKYQGHQEAMGKLIQRLQ